MFRPTCTGAILIGGQSRRMGRPKHLIELRDGRTMIEHVAAALAEVCGPGLLVGGAGDGCGALSGWSELFDRRPGEGPLAGVEALLESGRGRRYLVCPCDIPLIEKEVLLALSTDTAAPVAAIHIEGEPGPRPLPLQVTVEALPAITDLLDAGRRAVHQLLERVAVHVVPGPPEWSTQLTNMNRPEDLAGGSDGAT